MKTICLLIAFLAVSNNVYAKDGFATYYTTKSCQIEGNGGITTASGKPYNEQAMTCAMRRRDWGTKFLVYGHNTGKTVIVTLTDFGPGKKPTRRGVIIDLTPKAFDIVCGSSGRYQGKCFVSVQEIK